MRHLSAFRKAGILWTILALVAGTAFAQTPVGSQFQVNSYSTYDQYPPDISIAPDGSFVVVWASYSYEDESSTGITGQRYNSDGSQRGGEFQVNAYTTGLQYSPAVASAADGSFVVVWQHRVIVFQGELGSLSVQGQRFQPDGNPAGSHFQINTYTTGNQGAADVAVEPDGDFIVVWESFGSTGDDNSNRSVQGQRYASDGSPRGGEFQINTYTTSSQYQPTVGVAADGDFAVAWTSLGSVGDDTSSTSIQVRRFDSSGVPQSLKSLDLKGMAPPDFQVNTVTSDRQAVPDIGVEPDGDFVVVWHSATSPGDDDSRYSIVGRRFASDGSPRGGDFQVNSFTTYAQLQPSIAADADGDFVVVWSSFASNGSDTYGTSILGRRFTSSGDPIAPDFQVNTYTSGYQNASAVAAQPGGDFVVVWNSYGSDGGDTYGYSVQGQRFQAQEPSPGPELSIPGPLGGTTGDAVPVTLELTTNGATIGAVTFSIDFDESCLSFDPTDGDVDGIPDAITFQLPPSYTPLVFFDAGDTDGEIDVLLFEFPPATPLADGPLATVALDVICTPPPGGTTAAVDFSTDPAATFGDLAGQDVPGTAVGNVIDLLAGLRGDCNGDSLLTAGDITACGLESFDGDGTFWLDVPDGTFAGDPVGCDANGDTQVDAGDVSCKGLLIFGNPCGAPFTSADSTPLTIPELNMPSARTVIDGSIVVPVRLSAAGEDITSTMFSVDIDSDLVAFDPTDANGDGIPDAISFLTPASIRSVSFDTEDEDGELDFLISNLGPSAPPLSDGVLLEIRLTVVDELTQVVHGAVFSTTPRASFGDTYGQSVAGETRLLPLTDLFRDGFESGSVIRWTSIVP